MGRQVGLKTVEEFVGEMFQLTRADFALLTTEADLNAKNRPTNSFSYKGMDSCNRGSRTLLD